MLSEEEFKAEKSQLLNTHKIDVEYFCNMYGFTRNDYNKAQQDILDEWQKLMLNPVKEVLNSRRIRK